ncbi:hypothetical protein GCM10010478_23380 [Streptomyces erythrogriseus]|uniref:Uncharacterized protein n=3 Tax=Streptomyces TaxID=1883 RepID=A0ABN3WPC8_9ACTN|nr:hypothetical protein GCM10010265_56190 [Streptomyces griseoincarnatus]GGT69026.1 hypothetical protein GCM10010287_49630 [Streptomyces variabilis]
MPWPGNAEVRAGSRCPRPFVVTLVSQDHDGGVRAAVTRKSGCVLRPVAFKKIPEYLAVAPTNPERIVSREVFGSASAAHSRAGTVAP